MEKAQSTNFGSMHRNIRLLYLHNLLTDFRFQGAFAIIYFQQVTGSYTLASTVLALEVISAALLDIPTGVFSDKIGRKYTLMAGSIFMAASFSCYAFARGFWILMLGAAFFGMGYALFSGNNNALLYESLKARGQEKQFHHYQGRVSSMFQLGLGASALIASFIAPHGLRIVFICGIFPQVLAAIVSLFFVEPRAHIEIEEKSFAHMITAVKTVMHNPRLRLLTLAHAIAYGVGEATFMFGSAFINMLWPTWAVAIYRAGAHALGFIGYWFAGPVLDRINAAAVLAFGTVYGLVAELAATLMANVISPVVFLSVSLFFGPYMVARDQIMQEEFTDRQRATSGSVVSFCSSLVGGAASLGFGVIADHYGVRAAMLAGVLAGGLSAPLYWRLFRKYF